MTRLADVNGDLAAALIGNRVALLGGDPAGVVGAEATVAGVALAGLGGDLEKALPLDGEIQGRIGAAHAALAEVARHAVGADELDRARALRGEGGGPCDLLGHQGLELEAGGVGVGDVVRDDIHLALQHHLLRQSDVESVVHAIFL